jgi:hypothetical protein
MKRFGAAPCQWSSPGSKNTRSPGADHLDRSAAALAEADTFGDVDGLAVGVGVPRSPRARREVDTRGTEAGRFRGRGDGVDVDGAGEILARPGCGLGAAAYGDLHVVLHLGWDCQAAVIFSSSSLVHSLIFRCPP